MMQIEPAIVHISFKVIFVKVVDRSFFQKTILQALIKWTFIYRIQQLCIPEYWIVLVRFFEVQGNQAGHPAMAMYDVGRPAEFSDSLHDPFTEKHHSFGVIGKNIVLFVLEHLLPSEKFIVVQDI